MDVKLVLHANDRFQSKEQNQKIISVHKVPLRMQQSKAKHQPTTQARKFSEGLSQRTDQKLN